MTRSTESNVKSTAIELSFKSNFFKILDTLKLALTKNDFSLIQNILPSTIVLYILSMSIFCGAATIQKPKK